MIIRNVKMLCCLSHSIIKELQFQINIHIVLNVDGAMHFIYSHKYNTISAEDSSDMN